MIVDRVMPPILGRRYGGSLSSCKIMLVLINNDYSLGQGEERLNGFNHGGDNETTIGVCLQVGIALL